MSSFRKRIFRGAAVGWGFGFGYFLTSTYWIGYAFYVDADRYAALMPLAVTGLAAGARPVLRGSWRALQPRFWRRGYARIAGFVFAFFCAEAARGYLLTGFPWNLFGEALAANDAHMQMAAYIGVYGLTLSALFIFSAPVAAVAVPKAHFGPAFGCPGLICAVWRFIRQLRDPGVIAFQQSLGDVEGARVRIVQPNIPHSRKNEFRESEGGFSSARWN